MGAAGWAPGHGARCPRELCAHTCIARMHAANRCALHAFKHAARLYSTHPRCANARCTRTRVLHTYTVTARTHVAHIHTAAMLPTRTTNAEMLHAPHRIGICAVHAYTMSMLHTHTQLHAYITCTHQQHAYATHTTPPYIYYMHTHTVCAHIQLDVWHINTCLRCTSMHRHCTHIHKYVKIIPPAHTNVFMIGRWGPALPCVSLSQPGCERAGEGGSR